MAPIADQRHKVTTKLGERVYTVGEGQVGEMRDSTALRNDPQALRERFAEDGYVYLHGVIPEEVVAKQLNNLTSINLTSNKV